MAENNSSSPPAVKDPTKLAMILWADPRTGLGSTARSISRQLQEPAHGYQILELDLPHSLSPGPWIQSVASLMGHRLETSMLAALGWQEVQAQGLPGQPLVVVAMDPGSAAVVDSWRAKGLIKAPLVGVVSGLYLDPAWARTGVDRLSVVDPTQAEAGLSLGLSLDCLVPSGLYVCSGFSSVRGSDRADLRRKFALEPERPVALVVTDSMTPDELSSALFQLSLVADKATVMFDVARDEDSAELLRRRAGLYDFSAQMFGKVEDAGQLWAAADLVLAKPHLYVEQRAVALGLPYLFLLPAAGAEQTTARNYVERGMGRSVGHISTLAADVELMLNPEALRVARAGMGEIAIRKAVVEIARLVAQVGASREQIMAEERGAQAEPQQAPTPVGTAAMKGPLETIGGAGAPRAEAEREGESLDDLLSAEEDLNRRISEHHAEVERWDKRAALARGKAQGDLAAEAECQAEQHRAAMHTALAELARLSQRKAALPRSPEPADEVERSFREMEVEAALADLKRKL